MVCADPCAHDSQSNAAECPGDIGPARGRTNLRRGRTRLGVPRASKAAHLKHGFPLDYGFDDPWPTSLSQFDERRPNVSVESWFGNRWLKTHRPAALAATLCRRAETAFQSASLMGFTPLTPEGQRRVVEYCQEGIELPDSFRFNSLSAGEKVWWARKVDYKVPSGSSPSGRNSGYAQPAHPSRLRHGNETAKWWVKRTSRRGRTRESARDRRPGGSFEADARCTVGSG